MATPVSAATATATQTLSATAAPARTAMPIATITTLRPTSTTDSAETIYLPHAASSNVITVTPAPYPQPESAPTQAAPAAYLVPTNTPTQPPATPAPTNTAIPTVTPVPLCIEPAEPPPEADAPRFGLHASADPAISAEERCLFHELRPSLIKVLTLHPPPDLAKLIQSQPYPDWIVRTFLSFGGRDISPEDFVRFTLSDTQRTARLLADFNVVVELHNEPNLTQEGLQTSWQDGTAFDRWWLDILAQFRSAMPTTKFIYPGLSPGDDVPDVRQAHVEFIEQSRDAVAAADGLGVHLYWSDVSPLTDALATLDDYIGRFPNKPIWITEASYNTGGIDDEERARQYLAFATALQNRPTVQGVTFFVASASDPTFADETWLGTSLATRLGRRDK